jgi:putative hydrolase of the HAD superfamily
MKYKAVIFDLFGTLIDNYSIQQYEGVLRQMASVLSAPSEGFVQLWYDTFNERCTGVFKSPEDNINYVCRKLGVPIEDSQRNLATQIRLDLTVQSMIPVPESIIMLSHLKSEGYKTGLITDCSAEVPAIWQNTSFAPLIDVAIFSCKIGIKKPDPRIYQLAAERLRVEPHSCLYIGDGSSQELTGAAAAGMHPVLIRDPKENSTEIHRVDAEADKWDGPVIPSLKEVLTLLE